MPKDRCVPVLTGPGKKDHVRLARIAVGTRRGRRGPAALELTGGTR